ncbi:MAG: type I glyceraldehyde-3-phosphate dehydrogenase [Proteobacteria bacterium]|nr:MAG: type I glyceraldehyde-3-phosphate dehydrogenase [Pseudomonadota bacterium]
MRIAINGFGRIGRKAMRLAVERGIEIVAINSLSPADVDMHLLSFDSVHGPFKHKVEHKGHSLFIDGKEIKIAEEKDPAKLPWKEWGVDVVLECTGAFTDREKAALHLKAGAKKVIISAPSKDADVTICMKINEQAYDPAKHDVISNASCTTNALAPLAKILDEEFGIEKGLMTTIHSYTNDQKVLDLPHADMRRARAAALNMIPTSTGAAKAIGLVLPQLKGKLDGTSVRVPTPNVSLVDLSVLLKKNTTKEEINATMKKHAEGAMKGILRYEDRPLVSTDYNGDTHSSNFDSDCTMVTGGNLVKVLSWYDNESGYSARLLDLAVLVGKGL